MLATGSQSSFASGVDDLINLTTCRRIESIEEKEAAYRLRYEAYLREGAIAHNDSRRLTDEFDENANTTTFGVFIEAHLASSIRLSVATSASPDFPAGRIFPEILKPRLDMGQTVIDPTRFVIDRASARRYPKLAYVTVRLAWMACEFFGADLLLATPRVEHQAFYRRTFGHRVICPPRPYFSLKKPLSLMMIEYPAARTGVLRRYPFFGSTANERSLLFDRGQQHSHEPALIQEPLSARGAPQEHANSIPRGHRAG